ncbi:MAG: hypothetical protein FWH16_00330 [Oscillospiraceae bacterium]|nr:hypothetical protein [Oscillospiraceae bacterium]
MDIYNGSQAADPRDMASRIEESYPESYRRIYPHVRQLVSAMNDDDGMTGDGMERMADEAVARSGMLSDPAPVHSRGALGDIARILIARELFDRRRGRGGFLPFAPFMFMPIDYRGGFRGGYHGGFGGFRDGFRDGGFDGFRDGLWDGGFDGFRDGYRDRDGFRDRDGYRYWY